MASIFISHSSRDNAAAERLRGVLERNGFQSVFLDFDPEAGIPAGRHWEDELYSELRKADVVVFLSTQEAVRSKWCHAELAFARALGRAVVPVLLEPGAVHPLVADTQWIRNDPGDGRIEERVAEALRRITRDPRFELGWDTSKSPYPGLRSFDESRAGVFYGREAETEELVARITWPHAKGSERLVLVVGPSGCGKSSIVRGGALPQLERREGPWIVVPPVVPRNAAIAQLATSLARAFAESGGDVAAEAIEQQLRGNGLPKLVGELCRLADVDDSRGGLVITIDQAEQLTTDSAPERLEFVGALAEALDAAAPIRVIATLRDEYLTRVLAGTELEGRATSSLPVGPLTAERLAEVIAKPAERAGVDFEPGLVQRIVEETTSGAPSGGDPLPLLAFTLQQVFEQRVSPTRITLADYETVGGVRGALRAEADRAYTRLEQRGRAAAIAPALLELVNIEADEPHPTGRSAKRGEFDAAEWDVIQEFVDARLVTTEGKGPTVTVAHEALLRDWPVLESEIRRSRDKLVARSRLERDAKEWELAGRSRADLLSGPRLRAAIRAARDEPQDAVDQVVADYLATSRREARRSRALVFAVALAVLAGVAALAAGAWYVNDRRVERGRQADARAELVPLGAGPSAPAVDSHEVTYGQYRLCVLEDCDAPSEAPPAPDFERARAGSPIVFVEARDADRFCAWLGRRLPTLDELHRASRTRAVRHLLDATVIGGTRTGGREWTSTRAGDARATLGRDPNTLETIDDSSSRAELDLGFRCAEP